MSMTEADMYNLMLRLWDAPKSEVMEILDSVQWDGAGTGEIDPQTGEIIIHTQAQRLPSRVKE